MEDELLGNLFPRLFLSLSPTPPLSLGERPWLRLVTCPLRLFVVQNVCCVGGVEKCFDCLCDKLCEFQNLEQSLKTTRSIGVRSQILPMIWVLHYFCRRPNIVDLRSQRNSAAEWSTNLWIVSTCKTSRTESKWNQWINFLNLNLNSELIYFLLCAGILKSIFVTRLKSVTRKKTEFLIYCKHRTFSITKKGR